MARLNIDILEEERKFGVKERVKQGKEAKINEFFFKDLDSSVLLTITIIYIYIYLNIFTPPHLY